MSRLADDYRTAAAAKQAECARNRALLLLYPDLTARLRDPPYRSTTPANWTGYIPGPFGPENHRGIVQLNNSPVRAQLLELVTEAAQRADHETQGP